MADDVCVLCNLKLENSTDRNLVDCSTQKLCIRKGINDLPFKVPIDRSKYVCKRCLWLLTKRSKAVEKLLQTEREIRNLYTKNCPTSAIITALVYTSGKLTIKSPFLDTRNIRPSLLLPFGDPSGDPVNEPSSTSQKEAFEPLISSTPKSKSTRKWPQVQPDDIDVFERSTEKNFKSCHPEGKDCAAVLTIKWRSCEQSKNLSADLHQIAKRPSEVVMTK